MPRHPNQLSHYDQTTTRGSATSPPKQIHQHEAEERARDLAELEARIKQRPGSVAKGFDPKPALPPNRRKP